MQFTIVDVVPANKERWPEARLGYSWWGVNFVVENLTYDRVSIGWCCLGYATFQLRTGKNGLYIPQSSEGKYINFTLPGKAWTRIDEAFMFEVPADETPVELWALEKDFYSKDELVYIIILAKIQG